MIYFKKFISLPVVPILLVLMTTRIEPITSSMVKLYNQDNENVEIGDVVANDKTVGELKQILAKYLEMDVDGMRLLADREPMLIDEKPLSYYLNIEDDAIIRMRDDLSQPDAIEIGLNRIIIRLVVTKEKTLGWLKREVLGEEEKDLYRVFYEGAELFDQSKTLGEYRFFKGAYISMMKSDDTFHVTVAPPTGDNFNINEVTVETSVGDLKRLLAERRTNLDNEFLFYRYERMEDNRKLYTYSRLFQHGMVVKLIEQLGKSGGILELYYKKRHYTQHFPVFVSSNNTVGDLKRYAFQVDRSIPPEQMIFIFEDKILGDDDSRELSEFAFYSGASLKVNRTLNSEESGEQTSQIGIERQNDNGLKKSESRINFELQQSEFDNPNSKVTNQNERLDLGKVSDKECWICYDEMTDEEPNVITDCAHMFHQKCLVQWRDDAEHEGSICPTCRYKLTYRCYQPIVKLS